jgi:phenylalanyl-tRNA synthetase beta chain
MKISPAWLRDFVDLKVEDRQLADDLTLAGTAVENIIEGGIFEMEITTNRPDCMNHYGIARECSAIFDVALRPITAQILPAAGEAKFPIEIEDVRGCARYTARIIRGVKIGPSPEPVARRLQAVDQRAINNVADASNYALWEMGHPTHAFDLDLLRGKIVVRRARAGETLKTLDGVDRKLSPDDMVIADGERAIALAGVMGGFDTMITERTRNVLIESAWFDPASIRRSSRRHNLHTDASHRFERGADFGSTSLACARVAQLVLESAGGSPEGGEIDVIARPIQLPLLKLHRSEVKRILGEDLSGPEIQRILTSLGFGVTPGRAYAATVVNPASPGGSGGAHAAIAEEVADFVVQVPTWRLDVEREIDLIEEIARIRGYNTFPNTLPSFAGAVVEAPDAAKSARVGAALLALGYNQAISLSFVAPEDAARFSIAAAVRLANPLSEEMSVLRTSLVPSMLDMLARNLNRGNEDVRLFEEGHVFEMAGTRSEERNRLCLGATGAASPLTPHQPPRPLSFFDLKGDVETLLEMFEYRSLYFDAHGPDYYHPGRSARAVMDGAAVARFGQIHPEIAAARKIRQDVLIAEVFLDRLYARGLRQHRFRPIPRYPAVQRDFSFVFPEAVTFDRIHSAVAGLQIPEMVGFQPVEIFRGGAIPSGRYSGLLRATFQSAERTLREEEVAAWSERIVVALRAVGGVLRA